MQTDRKKPKLFDIHRLSMDIGRIVCAPLPLILRLKRITPEGEKYREKLCSGAIVAANHTSFCDPFVVGVTFWYRRVFFMAAEVVMKNKLVAFLLKGIGCIKIDRNKADLEAIKKCVSVLKEGRVLSVFPQGGISDEGSMSDIKSGAVLMALQANVPIVPMYIHQRRRWYLRRTVVIGKTISPSEMCAKKMPSLKDISTITDAVLYEMNRCKESIK